jgi:hypothetical protein
MGINYADVTVAIPFVRVESSQNPNLRIGDGADPAAAYFRAMVVAFASVRRLHPDIRLKLVSNAVPPPDFTEDFADLSVEVSIVPFDHRPPRGFTQRFEASLYILDALAHSDTDIAIFIDPDVLCVSPLDEMLANLGRSPGALCMDYTPGHDINGLSRQQAGELHALLGEPLGPPPTHFGGELYVFPMEHVPRVLARCEEAWALALSRHRKGLSKFTTEEHILSYALRGAAIHELNAHAARVWTARSYRNVNGSEKRLALWHLPAEKDRGFATLYAAYGAGRWPVRPDEFKDWAAREMGVYSRTPNRIAIDTLGQIVGCARKLVAAIKS